MAQVLPRKKGDPIIQYVSPYVELNAGLWSLWAGATVFLALRLWCKYTRRAGFWYDDYILIISWVVLLADDALIVHEFATGYILKDSTEKWDDRMHILINISSCLTLMGQAWTKTAFGVTLMRLSNQWQKWVLWFCIGTMNLYMIIKVVFQWAKVCGKKSFDNYYRLDFCLDPTFRDDFKEGGNVYNIIMDFVFAAFPWFITRPLDMRRVEKIGLCATMSLGMVVAIVSAVRISWKDDGNSRDEYYIWRNAMSLIWYSSEIAGTIMVQCIPVLRPILRQAGSTFATRKLKYITQTTQNTTSAGDPKLSGKWPGPPPPEPPNPTANRSERLTFTEMINSRGNGNYAYAEKALPRSPLSVDSHPPRSSPDSDSTDSDMWPLTKSEAPRIGDIELNTREMGQWGFFDDLEAEKDGTNGLSPPPRRPSNK